MPMKKAIPWGVFLHLPSLTSGLGTLYPLHCSPAAAHLSTTQSCHLSTSHELSTTLSNPITTIYTDPSELDPLLYYPWSYPPYCYKSSTLELCVYTNATFASGRGISIFATPQTAKQFAQLPAFTNPSAHANINFPESSIPGRTTPLPSKGLGLLASRPLKRGDLITAYTPLLLVHREEVLSTSEREIFLRRAVDQLPEKSRDRYYELAVIYGVESVKVQDKLKANIFGVEVGGLEHLAIWPEAARVNHECGPNSNYRIDPLTLVHQIHAARDIAKNEEITVTYTNPFNPTSQRLASLSSAFHFTCSCPRCTYSSDTDKTLHTIDNLQTLLSDWSTPNPSRIATIADAELLIKLYKEEGLDAFLDVPYGHAALMYSAAGQEEGVVKYARLAKEAVGLKEGVGKGDWAFWGRIEKDPKGHWSWNQRKTVG